MTNILQSPIKSKSGAFRWHEFDRLPREVRDALNYSAFSVATSGLERMVAKHGARRVAQSIREWDEKRVDAAYEQREATDFLQELGL